MGQFSLEFSLVQFYNSKWITVFMISVDKFCTLNAYVLFYHGLQLKLT